MIVEKFTAMFDPEWAENEKRSKRRAVLAADVILCISENTKRDLVDILGVPESICRVMPLAGFLSASDVSRASDEKLPSDPFFLYVGDYRAPYKNFRRMVSVLGLAGKEFENYTLVVLSTMEPTIQEKNDFYNLMGRDDNIIFRTNCNDALLRAYYSACSVFICPSLYEGFGIPVLEALGCGAPVACSKTSSLPEVGGAFVEYFDPYDEQDISCAIKRALAAGRSEAMLVRRKYAESFSWKKTTEIFADAVKSLV